MIGKARGGVTYYRCKTSRSDPRTLQRFTDDPASVNVREDTPQEAIERFLADHLFGRGRLAESIRGTPESDGGAVEAPISFL
jgi:hypothetical protein